MSSPKTALCTVAIPVYNIPADMLARAVNSVLRQSYRDLELLLVDDGSDEWCAELCDAFAATDNRVRVIHQGNAGVSAARNKALDNSNGNWIMFVDGDDELLPGALQHAIEVGEKHDCDIVYGEVVDSFGERSRRRDLKLARDGEAIVREDPGFLKELETYFVSYEVMVSSAVPKTLSTGPVARLFKLEALGQLRFDVRLKIMEDALFNSIAASKARRVGFVCEPWYVYSHGHESSTTKIVFDDYARIHCAVYRESVAARGIPVSAYYSQACTYFFFVLNALERAGRLTYADLLEGYGLPWFKEAFALLDRALFDYQSTFSRLKYWAACSGHPLALWLLFRSKTPVKKLIGR